MSDSSFLGLIIARFDGDKLIYSDYRKYIEKLTYEGIGGFIVFGGDYETVKEFIFYLQSIAKKPLIIASDIERGVGQQIRGATIIPCQMGIAAGFSLIHNKQELERIYSVVVHEAKDIGINLALMPVLDVNTEPRNPIICTRAFSDDPEVVADYGKFVIKFFESNGVATCGKHFPGHGSTCEDSHLTLPRVYGDLKPHIKPFQEATVAGVSSIMVGHLSVFSSILKPATLSKKVITTMLKNKLGFNGVVVSDAMSMKAVSNFNNPYVMALKAGVDLILHPEDPYIALEEIKKAYRDGIINDKRIKQANERVDKLRERLKGNKNVIRQPIPFKAYLEFFKKTVTVLKNEIGDLTSLKFVPYLTGAYTSQMMQLFSDYFGLAFDLKEYKAGVGIPLMTIFTEIGFGKRYFITDEEIRKIKDITSTEKSVVVSFGNPYVVAHFSNAKAIVLVYDSDELAVLSFLEVFKEGLKTTARCPVKIFKE
ncbi:MAG: glycoside hydrolase family 3 N-terminal domain-containing protein [Thermodesulfovibrionaceae bacterium]